MTKYSYTTICLVDYTAAGDFFLRLATSKCTDKFHFVTTIPSFLIKTKKYKNVTCEFVNRFTPHKDLLSINVNECKEYHLKFMSSNDIQLLYSKLVSLTSRYIEDEKIKERIKILVWSSNSIMGSVAAFLRSKYAVSTCFFEISNLPGKLFVNWKGVNCNSSIYETPEYLTDFIDDSFDFNSWKNDFVKLKLNKPSNLPPQVKLGKKVSKYHVLDFIVSSIVGFRFYSYQSIFSKLGVLRVKNNLIQKQTSIPFSNDVSLPYIFFPMQVSSDTQVMMNSEYNNIQALDYLLNNSPENIIIKPHPAERDISYLFKYISQNNLSNRVQISNLDTYFLIEGSLSVFVINSTVGLEAMLFNKKVKFIGKTFFSHFTERLLSVYVGNYLLDIDFFSKEKIEEGLVDKIFSDYDRKVK